MSDDKPKKKRATKKLFETTRNIFLENGKKVKAGELVKLSAAEAKTFEHCIKAKK